MLLQFCDVSPWNCRLWRKIFTNEIEKTNRPVYLFKQITFINSKTSHWFNLVCVHLYVFKLVSPCDESKLNVTRIKINRKQQTKFVLYFEQTNVSKFQNIDQIDSNFCIRIAFFNFRDTQRCYINAKKQSNNMILSTWLLIFSIVLLIKVEYAVE